MPAAKKTRIKSTGGFMTPGGTAEQRRIAAEVTELLGRPVDGEMVQYMFAVWRRRGGKAEAPIKTAQTRLDAIERTRKKLTQRTDNLTKQQQETEKELQRLDAELKKLS